MSEPTTPPVHDFSKHLAAVEAVAAPNRLPKVFVALCSRDWQVEHLTSEFVRNIGNQCKCQIQPLYMANDGVARSRNNLAAAFLDTDGTHLLFLDNDIFGRPQDVDRLLEGDRDIICGLYPKKQPVLDWVMNGLPDEKLDERGVLRVRQAGTGFMMVKRIVFERMIEKLPEIAYGGDPEPKSKRWDFFPMYAKDGKYLSEDWFFCDRARQLGFEIHMDTRVQLRHVGKIVYPLQFSLTDDECVDIIHHRYGISPDHIRSFFASGDKPPHFMGGHMPRLVRHWPAEFPVGDLHQGAELSGCYDVPEFKDETRPAIALDVGADVGAFAIWAAKRWPGLTVHSYETRPEIFQCLEHTQERLRQKHAQTTFAATASGEPLNAEAAPEASIIKIDIPGAERDIIQALIDAGKMARADFILVKYSDDTVPLMLGMMTNATHWMHCHQRFIKGTGIVKLINRRLMA